MALKFTSIAYVILQVTKKETTQGKKKTTRKKETKKYQWMNNFVITEIAESEPSKFGYLSIKYFNLWTY